MNRQRTPALLSLRPNSGEKVKTGSALQIKLHGGAGVLRGVVKSEALRGAEAAEELGAGGEVLAAEFAGGAASDKGQRPAGAEDVAELPGVAREFFSAMKFSEKFQPRVKLERMSLVQLRIDFAASLGVLRLEVGDTSWPTTSSNFCRRR